MLNVTNDLDTIDYCKQLAKVYVRKSCEVYGDHWSVSNAHGLLHIPDDVYRFGAVDEISCFEFEGFLYFVKQFVRSGRLPLQQAINRYVHAIVVSETLVQKLS